MMIQIPAHDSAFRFLDDGQGVAIHLSETGHEMAELIFRDMGAEGWQWSIEGQQADYPSYFIMPIGAPNTLPTLGECAEEAIDFLKLYAAKTGDMHWMPAIHRIETFVAMNTTINTRPQLGPGTCSLGYDMEV